ncbi:hypothetical protein E2C01_069561 [Portunus trituberculatus]|uniref:Uncharacterized protein n=1 Tax=Portunus trituberculatus TaxID=210409 RepID=A0A5B7I146_PORTR|nr:hypothetical protein [Portunus trituberculatus]
MKKRVPYPVLSDEEGDERGHEQLEDEPPLRLVPHDVQNRKVYLFQKRLHGHPHRRLGSVG